MSVHTVKMASNGGAMTATTTAARAALALPRAPVTASATAHATMAKKTSADATCAARGPRPKISWATPLTGSSNV